MEGWRIWLFSFLSLLIVVLFGLIFFSASNLGLSSVDLEECKTLSEGANDGTNIVFFSTRGEAKKYMDYFLGFEPFDQFNDRFNFYYIDSYKPECEIYKGVALLCYSKELVAKASSCPNDYIVVLEDMTASLRSSSYVNVISINTRHPMSVLAHEFGHAFANFAEEYIPAKIPKGARNCVEECLGFGGLEDGCYAGCSEANMIRSIENGVMRTLKSEDYGNFNNAILVERIGEEGWGGSITGNVVEDGVDCYDEEYYLIEGGIKNGFIDIGAKSIESGCVGNNGNGGFAYSVILSDGETLDADSFNPELIFTIGPEDESGEKNGAVFDSDKNFFLKIPLIKGSQKLEIRNLDGSLLNSVNLYDIDRRLCQI